MAKLHYILGVNMILIYSDFSNVKILMLIA